MGREKTNSMRPQNVTLPARTGQEAVKGTPAPSIVPKKKQ